MAPVSCYRSVKKNPEIGSSFLTESNARFFSFLSSIQLGKSCGDFHFVRLVVAMAGADLL